jgi:hypothetical protein
MGSEYSYGSAGEAQLNVPTSLINMSPRFVRAVDSHSLLCNDLQYILASKKEYKLGGGDDDRSQYCISSLQYNLSQRSRELPLLPDETIFNKPGGVKLFEYLTIHNSLLRTVYLR